MDLRFLTQTNNNLPISDFFRDSVHQVAVSTVANGFHKTYRPSIGLLDVIMRGQITTSSSSDLSIVPGFSTEPVGRKCWGFSGFFIIAISIAVGEGDGMCVCRSLYTTGWLRKYRTLLWENKICFNRIQGVKCLALTIHGLASSLWVALSLRLI
jgi:hypothetical protein